MPEYLTPGVYVEEIDSGSKPIEGVGINTCAFIGYAKSGDFNTPTFVSSWTQFCELFGQEENKLLAALSQALGITQEQVIGLKNDSGKSWLAFTANTLDKVLKSGGTLKGDKGQPLNSLREFYKAYGLSESVNPYINGSYLAHSVFGFYNNGGGRAYVVRVPYAPDAAAAGEGVGRNGKGAVAAAGPKMLEPARAAIGPMTFTAKESGPGGNDIKIDVEVPEGGGEEFRIKVSKGDANETFPAPDRTMKMNQVQRALRTSTLISVDVQDAPFEVQPMTVLLEGGLETTNASVPALRQQSAELALYASAPISDLAPNDFVGDEANRTGAGGLSTIEDVNMICVPDLMAGIWKHETIKIGNDEVEGEEVLTLTPERRQAILDAQCNLVAYCENMADRQIILDPVPGLTAQQMRDLTNDTPYGSDRGQAAIYYPWIKVSDPQRKGKQIFVPPCGHIAGVWARVGSERGVHKAPANEILRGAVALENYLTRNDQAILNPDGINAIRQFPGEGIKIYGARTLATRGNPSWKYINVRRLFNYIEKSVEKSIGWAVFEPNDPDLWGRLRRNISAFLWTSWKEGMLFGAVPGEAYYVKCDTETNPQEMIDLGRVYVEVGLNPVKPAEFVIIRMGQWDGGANVSET